MAVELKHILMTGRKSIELPQYPTSAWDFLTGEEQASPVQSIKDYYSIIPWLHRGVDVRAASVASMPFTIYKGDEAVASYPDEWDPEAFSFFPNPLRLLWLVEASLVLCGQAYMARGETADAPLRYLLPSSVSPKLDSVNGLTGFTRQVGAQSVNVKVEDIIYWWQPDPYVEIGPGKTFPARAAAQAAGVLYNVDAFVTNFFARGAVKATLLTLAGGTDKNERTRLEEWWKSFVQGLNNSWSSKVVNADMVKAVPIGEGLESLNNQLLTREKREDIAAALGIPQTLLFSDASTNATAGEDTLHFLQRTIVPECKFIQAEFNDQFWNPAGYSMEFEPESLEAFQEDEAKRSVSLKNLTDAGVALDVALAVLGYDLDEEQTERIREEMDKPKPSPTVVFGGGNGAMPPPPEGGSKKPPTVVSRDKLSELRAWEKFEVRRLGKARSREFECRCLGQLDADRIRRMAAACVNEDELHALFEGEQARLSPDIAELAGAIERATRALADPEEDDEVKSSDLLQLFVKSMESRDAMLIAALKSGGGGLTIQAEGMSVLQELKPPNVQVDVHVPAVKAPDVQVAVAAPIVNVAQPDIKQTIVTPGPERVVRSVEKQKVNRNAMGDMTDTEAVTTYEYGGV
jgi:phage portal protein BeeE